MSRRGQVEPIAAIAAVFAIAVGFALYAGVASEVAPEREGTDAEATMHRLEARALSDGILSAPPAINASALSRPGEAVNVTVETEAGSWAAGPEPPGETEVARRPVTVRVDAGRQVPGWLRLEVWET